MAKERKKGENWNVIPRRHFPAWRNTEFASFPKAEVVISLSKAVHAWVSKHLQVLTYPLAPLTDERKQNAVSVNKLWPDRPHRLWHHCQSGVGNGNGNHSHQAASCYSSLYRLKSITWLVHWPIRSAVSFPGVPVAFLKPCDRFLKAMKRILSSKSVNAWKRFVILLGQSWTTNDFRVHYDCQAGDNS